MTPIQEIIMYACIILGVIGIVVWLTYVWDDYFNRK